MEGSTPGDYVQNRVTQGWDTEVGAKHHKKIAPEGDARDVQMREEAWMRFRINGQSLKKQGEMPVLLGAREWCLC